jgi:hypothetical protein
MLEVIMLRMFFQGLLGLLCFIVLSHASSVATAMSMDASDTKRQMQHLIAKARSQGTVRVIVSLNTPFVPEGELSDQAAVDEQRAAIADSQDGVLDRLCGCTVEAVRRYKYTPAIAMGVDACGLRRLMKDSGVSRVSEDVPLPPT